MVLELMSVLAGMIMGWLITVLTLGMYVALFTKGPKKVIYTSLVLVVLGLLVLLYIGYDVLIWLNLEPRVFYMTTVFTVIAALPLIIVLIFPKIRHCLIEEEKEDTK
jgi:hypothetical protein